MGLFDNVERAARDPYYRLLYEDQQRRDKLNREIAETLKRSSSSSSGSKASQGSDFEFTLPEFSSSSPSSDPISDEAFGAVILIGGLIALGFGAVSLLANYGHLIVKYAGVFALLATATALAVNHWQRVGPFITVPLTWTCWAAGLWLTSKFGLGDLIGTIVAAAPAICLGTAIWPRHQVDDDWLLYCLTAAQWLGAFVTFFFVFVEIGLSWRFGNWIGSGVALAAAILIWSAFHVLRSALPRRGGLHSDKVC